MRRLMSEAATGKRQRAGRTPAGGPAGNRPARGSRCSRVVARRFLVALLFGFAMLTGGVAGAQTVATLVSNADQGYSGGGAIEVSAQSFTTGSHGTGYTLSSVKLWPFSAGPAADRSGVYATVKTDDNGRPGSTLAVLRDPAHDFTGTMFETFTAPANTTLRRNSTYWVVVNEGRSEGDRTGWAQTDSDAEDAVSLANWSIGDDRANKTGTGWSDDPQRRALLMTVQGYANGNPKLGIAAGRAAEGGTMQFAVTLDDPAEGGAVTVQYTTSDDTATAGTDYTAVSAQTLTIPSGQTSGTISITTTQDSVEEDDETFTVTLSSLSSNADFGTATSATGTIVDNDGKPSLSIADAFATEGSNLSFTVTAHHAVADEMTVEYTTSIGAGDTASSDDFSAASNRTLTIAAGDTSGAISIATTHDASIEPDETFTVTLSSPSSNAELGTVVSAKGTIRNDDFPPTEATLSLSQSSVAEDADATTVTVTVELNGTPREEPTVLTIAVGAPGDTAVEGTDYTSVNDFPVTVDAGRTTGTADFTMTPADDSLGEGDKQVSVTGTAPADVNVTVTGTELAITDDEVVSTKVVLSLSRTSVAEDAAAVTVTVTANLNKAPRGQATAVTVAVGAAADSATEGTDYETVDDFTFSIGPGQDSATASFTLTPVDDDIDEDDESIAVHGNVQGLSVKSADMTIADNDTRGLALSESSLSVPEGGSSTYTVALDSQPRATVTVAIAGTAGTDLTLDSSSLTFTTSNWEQAQTVEVSASQDTDRLDDDVTLTHAASGGGYGSLSADLAAKVVDDDVTVIVANGVAVTSSPLLSRNKYGRDEIIRIGVTFDAAVAVDTTNGTPAIAVTFSPPGGDAVDKEFEYAGGSGSTTLVFEYQVQAGDRDNNGIFLKDNGLALNGGTIKDAQYHWDVDLGHIGGGGQANHRVDGTRLADPAGLSSLALSGVNLNPAFSTNTTTYSAGVGYGVAVTKVTAAAAGYNGTLTISPADSDSDTAGHQVALDIGATEITDHREPAGLPRPRLHRDRDPGVDDRFHRRCCVDRRLPSRGCGLHADARRDGWRGARGGRDHHPGSEFPARFAALADGDDSGGRGGGDADAGNLQFLRRGERGRPPHRNRRGWRRLRCRKPRVRRRGPCGGVPGVDRAPGGTQLCVSRGRRGGDHRRRGGNGGGCAAAGRPVAAPDPGPRAGHRHAMERLHLHGPVAAHPGIRFRAVGRPPCRDQVAQPDADQ